MEGLINERIEMYAKELESLDLSETERATRVAVLEELLYLQDKILSGEVY